MEITQKIEIDPIFRKLATTREELAAIGREANVRMGIPAPPQMTREELNAAVAELHASQIAHGIRPEDNGASRELLRMRYGDDYDQDAD